MAAGAKKTVNKAQRKRVKVSAGNVRETKSVYLPKPPMCDAAWQRAKTAALKLDVAARARLAGSLLLSLDAPSDEENLHLWVDESERRLNDLRAGRAKEIPMSEALGRARAALA